MIVSIKVITNAKQEKIVENGKILKVYVTAIPEKGKANKAVIKLLSKYYKVAKSNITIVKGETSNNKKVEII